MIVNNYLSNDSGSNYSDGNTEQNIDDDGDDDGDNNNDNDISISKLVRVRVLV